LVIAVNENFWKYKQWQGPFAYNQIHLPPLLKKKEKKSFTSLTYSPMVY